MTTSIAYTYDAAGNRIGKSVTVGGGTTVQTWYVRDASGNVMTVYENNNPSINSNALSQIEVHLYGSSRLGMWKGNRNAVGLSLPTPVGMTGITSGLVTYGMKRGEKIFELSNHLGNVLVTLSDISIGHDNGTGVIDYYIGDVVTANDYYPFGTIMQGRKISTDGRYRYGFNGKENDGEVKGEANQQDYGLRIYDPRIGRFLSVDPLSKSFPWYTPYQFAGNGPIWAVDLDGAEPQQSTKPDKSETTLNRNEVATILQALQKKDDLKVWKEGNARNPIVHTPRKVSAYLGDWKTITYNTEIVTMAPESSFARQYETNTEATNEHSLLLDTKYATTVLETMTSFDVEINNNSAIITQTKRETTATLKETKGVYTFSEIAQTVTTTTTTGILGNFSDGNAPIGHKYFYEQNTIVDPKIVDKDAIVLSIPFLGRMITAINYNLDKAKASEEKRKETMDKVAEFFLDKTIEKIKK